jgi:hypothetical protein
MKPHLTLTLLALAVGGIGAFAADVKKAPVVAAVPVVSPTVAGFEAFRLISDRNIFNPNRIGRSSRNSDDPPPRVDVISFVGTMDYEKGLFAFFDSPDGAYRKALHEGDTIDKFTVKNITANSVDLVRDPKPFTLRMGQQLRRPIGGDWTLIGEDVVRQEARAAEAAAAASSAPPAIPADASEALRKLMERRQQQLKQ